MESWYPFVIGTVIFLYIQSFNRIARIHFEEELVWKDFFTRVIPLVGVGIEPTMDLTRRS